MTTAFIRVMGGIGNQIFQYALAQWLAREMDLSPILYDPGSDARRGPQTRAVQLHELFPDCRISTGTIAKAVHWLSLSRKFQGTIGAAVLRHHALQDSDSWESVVHAMYQAKRRPYPVFSGYFQFADLVRSELGQLRGNAAAEIERRKTCLLQQGALAGMDGQQDCIVHVRLGDYRLISGFTVLGTAYYAPAAQLLVDRGFCGRVYCVSDEPAAARTILADAGMDAICLAIDDPLDVLAVLAHTRFKIIANSTLSLWGSLLGRDDAIVVFPTEWPVGNCEILEICRRAQWTPCSSRVPQ